jgi:hypothetical protein
MQYEDGNQKVNFKRIPNRMVVEKSIIEAKSQLKKFGHFLSDKHYTKSYMTKHVLTTNEIKDQIKDLVKYAPAAASQVLVNNPAYAPLMCDAINCVNKDQMIVDKKAENADRNMMIWGGVIVAGAVVTGGASIALAAAAPAVAAVAAATSTGFVIGGTVLGASSGVYYANRADEINQDYTKLKAAFIGTGAKDLDAWRVMSDQLNDLEEAKFNMYMAVGFTALDVASFGSLLKGLSSIERMRAVSKAVEMMDVGKWSPVRNARMIKIVQNGGEEGASKLFTVLSQFGKDQKYIDEFLLKASKLSKPELNKLIKNIDLALKEENGAQKAYSLMEQFHSRQKEIVVTAKKTEVKTKVKEIEPIQKGSPVTPEITASSESKYLTREEMDELHTHDNPVWKSESWTDETSRLMKHEPDAEMIQNEAFILQTDEKYSYVEERVLKESKQKITEHSGEYSTISMDARKLAGDAILDKKHFTEIEQKAHQVTIVDGKLYDAEGKLLDSRGFHTGNEAGQDHVIFVMDQKGNIFVGGEKGVYTDKANRQIYHSQLAGGKDVAAAGELKVVDGKIVGFTDRSGHYMPTPRLSLQFLEEAKKKGATLKEIEIDIHSMKTPGSNKTVEPVKAAVKNEEKLLGSGGNTLIYQGSDQSVRRVPRSQDEETKKAFWEYVQGTTESKKLGIPVIEHQYTVVSDGKDYLRYDGKSVIKSDAKGNPLGGETAKEISLEKLKNTYQPVFTSVPEVDMKQAVKVDDYLTELSSYRKMDAKAMTPEQLAKKAELEKKYPKFLEFVDQTAEFSKIGDFATHQAVFDPKTGDVLIMDLSSNQKKMKLIEGKGWYEYSTNNPSDLKLIKNQDKNIWSPYLKGGDYDPKTAQEIQERINSKRSNFQLNQKN